MYRHTTFNTGGPADLWVRPGKDIFPEYAAALIKYAGAEAVPVFFLGAGANILVSDRGIRGIVLDTGSWKGIGKREERDPSAEAKGRGSPPDPSAGAKGRGSPPGPSPAKGRPGFSVKVFSGTSIDGLVDRLMIRGLSGLEFLAGMPGSVGGAVWMNARCYEKSVSDVLLETEILDEELNRLWLPFKAEDFDYKKSPFQSRKVLILNARFAVNFRGAAEIRKEIMERRRDREAKGHYRYPSAGSAFKNNRAFGAPTGKIIDELGLRGLREGDAQVAPWHGNIVINAGHASAQDIRSLLDEVARRVKEERGLDLEREILFAGDWEERLSI
jgi:UDP-N-acetylmuramate dehydrogenase